MKEVTEIAKNITLSDDCLAALMDLSDADRIALEAAGLLTYQAETMVGGGLWEPVEQLDVSPEESYELICAADSCYDYTPDALLDLAEAHGGSCGEWRTIVMYDGQELGIPVEAAPFPWDD